MQSKVWDLEIGPENHDHENSAVFSYNSIQGTGMISRKIRKQRPFDLKLSAMIEVSVSNNIY